ncbi:hypothetical protein [Pedobacter glucosidilyticus]|uniref:hypothetical protein n=1 Tax=Pedobacter glucosidilyticus TaxID=1122941 RepID=UPI0026EEACC7|nr:hypothetical protein [Pedobacter glucosidilyticus]
MNSNKRISSLKGRDFNGTPYAKIKHVSKELGHKIRQLLRSFIPLNQPENEAQTGQKSQP